MDEIKKEVKKQSITYITTALALVAGLAWNDAIKELINYLFPTGGGILAKFIYAAGITIVVVILISYVNKLFKEKVN